MNPNRPQTARRKPGRPKTGEPSAVKPALLQTASALFMQFGYDSVSMEQLAASCGVTKASVYYYFPNKAELFTAAVASMMANIGKLTGELLERPGPLRERLTAVAEAHMRKAHVDFESLMREAEPALSAEQIAAIRDAERSLHLVLAEALRQEMKRGELRAGNPLLYAYAFSALLMLGSRGALPGAGSGEEGDFSAKIGPSDIVDLFWRGVGHMV